MKSFLLRTLLACASIMAFSVNAHWVLIDEQSSVHFVSTKNQHISEIHHFKNLQGEFSPKGQLKIDIDLASIDSGIEIRDTRMRETLFNVDKFSAATLTAQLPDSVLSLEKGHSILVTIPAELTLMNSTKTLSVAVQVTRKTDNGIVATSTQPTLISAADFGLAAGVEALKTLAGLSSIGLTVPVNFNLVFVAH